MNRQFLYFLSIKRTHLTYNGEVLYVRLYASYTKMLGGFRSSFFIVVFGPILLPLETISTKSLSLQQVRNFSLDIDFERKGFINYS